MTGEKGSKTDWRESIRQVEENLVPIELLGVMTKLQKIRRQQIEDETAIEPELDYEIFAAALREKKDGDVSEWGVCFGPIRSEVLDDGTVDDWPSRSALSSSMIEYWTKRASDCLHPVLRGRYAKLVWNLAGLANTKPDYRMAQIAVDAAIEIASTEVAKNELQAISELRIALSVAHSLGDQARIEAVRDAMIAYEEAAAVDEKLGLWGFSFDSFVRDGRGNASEEIQAHLVSELEQRLSRLADPNREMADPWKVGAAVKRLATYYRKQQRPKDTARVLRLLAESFDRAASTVDPMRACSFLEQSHAVMSSFNLQDEADAIAVKLRELGPRVRDSLKEIEIEGTLDGRELRENVAKILDGDHERVMWRIAYEFMPKKDEMERLVQELAEEHPLAFLFPLSLKDHLGRTITTIGSVDEDLAGRTAHQMSETMRFLSIPFRAVLLEAQKRGLLEADKLIEYFYGAPIFREEYKETIRHGLKLYGDGDYVSAIHVLIPQIEGALRTLLEKASVPVLRSSRGGGFQYRVLDDLLRDDATLSILGESLSLYLRVVLSDQRGWNIRNRVSHGLLPFDEMGFSVADRILHCLLCLALVRPKDAEAKGD